MGILILIVLILLFAIILLTRIRVLISYERIHEEDHCVVEVTTWFRIIRFKYEIPVIKLLADRVKINKQVETGMQKDDHTEETAITDETVKKWSDRFQELVEHVHNLYPTLRDFLKHLQCKEITWHTSLGIGDAAATGTLTGIIWSVKSMIVATLTGYVTLRAIPRMSVQPEWNAVGIQTRFRCILTFRIGHALVAGTRILLKLRKGREQKWQTTPSRA